MVGTYHVTANRTVRDQIRRTSVPGWWGKVAARPYMMRHTNVLLPDVVGPSATGGLSVELSSRDE